MPEINTDLFEKIHTQLTFQPESHDQSSWEDHYAECGTTRCTAGWAIFLHHEGEESSWWPSTPTRSVWHVIPERYRDGIGPKVDEYAEDLLGLTPDQSHVLFYADERFALALVDAYRRKDPEERARLIGQAYANAHE